MKNESRRNDTQTPTYSIFTLSENVANYIEFIDSHGFKFRMYISWMGSIATVKGVFGEKEFSSQVAIRMIETLTHVFPLPTEKKNRTHSISWAWTTLCIPPYERAIEVYGVGECLNVIISMIDSEKMVVSKLKLSESQRIEEERLSRELAA